MACKSKTSSQDWFYFSPPEPKKISEEDIPAPSQIPGLSHTDIISDDNDNQCKRRWIRDADTEYIKLAKAGGRKDLFKYKENSPCSEAVLYPRVDWFDHDITTDDAKESSPMKVQWQPEWYGHEEHVSNNDQVGSSKRPILGYDELSIWKREEQDRRLPEIEKKKKTRKSKSINNNNKEETKFPTILPRGGRKKSIDNGEMSDLLSFAYQKEFIHDSKERKIESKKKKVEEQREIKEKLERDREKYSRQKKTVERPHKPLFKLSKFGNIPSRIDSHRT